MAISVKWEGELVAEFDNDGQLTAATKTLQGFWNDFLRDGVRLISFPDPPSDNGVLGDSTEVSRELGTFLGQLRDAGFQIKETRGQ